MAGNIFRRNKNKLSDAIESELSNDPTANVADEASAGDGELTGPELEASRSHDDFSGMDDWNSTEGNTQVVGDPDTAPRPATPLTASPAVDGLAKQYILKSYESLQRTPSAGLSDNYRAQLLHFRELVKAIHNKGVRGIGRITSTVVGVLAVDQRGKIDAVMFLRQLMRQAVWQAAVDVDRARRAESKAQRRAGEEDETRAAPMGMDGMSDHSDAIAGVRGSSEAVDYNEADAMSALVEVNGFLSTFADAICDDANDTLYLGLEDGLSYLDKPGVIAGSWVGVHDVDEAIDIQLIKNQEGLAKRDAERAVRRREQLAQLAALLDN